MKIKASCVRCGKSIDGMVEIYCSACKHEVSLGALGQESPSSRPRSKKTLFFLMFLLLVVGLGAGYYKFRDQLFAPGGVMVRAKPVASPEGRQTKPTITETLLAEKIKKEEASESGGPPPQRPGAIEADVPEPDLTYEGAKKVEQGRPAKEAEPGRVEGAGTTPSVSLAEGGAPPATPSLTPPQTPAAPAPAPQEPVKESKAEETIWVYFAEKEGRDVGLVERLKGQGAANVLAKGRWTTKNKVNYIFYREESPEELDALKKKLSDMDFLAFPYEGVQTSRNLKSAFQDNPTLKFLVIVQ